MTQHGRTVLVVIVLAALVWIGIALAVLVAARSMAEGMQSASIGTVDKTAARFP